MPDPEVSARMREDWNARAREDAGYYVPFGRRDQGDAEFFATATAVVNNVELRRDQGDAEFFATATAVVNNLERELRRVPLTERGGWRALEIGCGPGRLMRRMSRHFIRIDGVDVSDEMIALAREKLRDVPNAYAHVTDGATLSMFHYEAFEFVYSYAVFQHIPSRDVVFDYL